MINEQHPGILFSKLESTHLTLVFVVTEVTRKYS